MDQKININQHFNLNHCTFELIADIEELLQEAEEMQHCILTFAERISSGHYYGFRVYFDDFRGTLGLIYLQDHFSFMMDQVYGIQNSQAPDHVHKVVQSFAQYLTVEDVYFENLLAETTPL